MTFILDIAFFACVMSSSIGLFKYAWGNKKSGLKIIKYSTICYIALNIIPLVFDSTFSGF